MRKEVIGNATLYLGDCRDIIPAVGPVGAVVTDPPYGIEDLTGGYGRAAQTISNDKTLDVCFAALNALAETQQNIRLLVFYSSRVTDDFFSRAGGLGKYRCEIIWDKKAPGLTGGENAFRYQHENIAIFELGTPPTMGGCFSVIPDMRTPTLHPHQKPQTLMQTLCNVANGDPVFDPFMGSGSTGVAALATGRRFIGCEIDPGHFETALRRVTEAQKQEGLF